MLFATLIGIFLIPVFYVVMQRISEGTGRSAPKTPQQGGRAAKAAGALPGAGHVP